MTTTKHVKTPRDVEALRAALRETAARTRAILLTLAKHDDVLARIKFERLGCDPLDPEDAQNICEQVDQQATYEAAVDALADLMARHPGLAWEIAAGARGSGHDIVSTNGEVAAEVFAAVKPNQNDKLRRDLAKVGAFPGLHRYVYFRSPARPRSEEVVGVVTVVSLGVGSPAVPA